MEFAERLCAKLQLILLQTGDTVHFDLSLNRFIALHSGADINLDFTISMAHYWLSTGTFENRVSEDFVYCFLSMIEKLIFFPAVIFFFVVLRSS
jgi:hypothetical protein